MGWSLGILALAQGSVVVVAGTVITDLPLSWAFVRGIGVVIFGTPGEGRQGVGAYG